MKNSLLRRLDRQLRLHGEEVQLQHTTGASTQTNTKANVRGVIKTLGIAQLLGGLTQTNYVVIISPTDLRKSSWPGAVAEDPVIPTVGDKMWFRAALKAISRVDAIYDGDECVRIELYCTG